MAISRIRCLPRVYRDGPAAGQLAARVANDLERGRVCFGDELAVRAK